MAAQRFTGTLAVALTRPPVPHCAYEPISLVQIDHYVAEDRIMVFTERDSNQFCVIARIRDIKLKPEEGVALSFVCCAHSELGEAEYTAHVMTAGYTCFLSSARLSGGSHGPTP